MPPMRPVVAAQNNARWAALGIGVSSAEMAQKAKFRRPRDGKRLVELSPVILPRHRRQ